MDCGDGLTKSNTDCPFGNSIDAATVQSWLEAPDSFGRTETDFSPNKRTKRLTSLPSFSSYFFSDSRNAARSTAAFEQLATAPTIPTRSSWRHLETKNDC